jgi:hypothetical protein
MLSGCTHEQNAFSKQIELRPTKTLPFQMFEFIDGALGGAIAPWQGESGGHSGEVVFEAGDDGVQRGQVIGADLRDPFRETVSRRSRIMTANPPT